MMEIKLVLNHRIKIDFLFDERCEFVIDGSKRAVFHGLDKNLFKLIQVLHSVGIEREDVFENLPEKSQPRGIKLIKELERCGLIDYKIRLNTSDLAIISPTRKSFIPFEQSHLDEQIDEQNCTFSQYNYFQVDTENVILNNPSSTFKIKFPHFSENLIKYFQGSFSYNECYKLTSILTAGGFLTSNESKTNSPSQLWEFQDLLFHKTTRLGSYDDGNLGGSYRFRNTSITTCRDFKNYNDHSYFPLIKPTTALRKDFLEILYKRQSSRSFTGISLSLEQLSEFLYHTAHVKKVCTDGDQDIVHKVFPSAGGLQEIEFYLLLNQVESLPKDIYYYNPILHGLYCLNVDESYINEINNNAKLALNLPQDYPQVIIFLCSRMRKVAWKYEKIAYRNTLVTVGTAFQAMYLVGTAMNLSTCAIGTSDPDLFARAINVNQLEEPCVAEFALGIS